MNTFLLLESGRIAGTRLRRALDGDLVAEHLHQIRCRRIAFHSAPSLAPTPNTRCDGGTTARAVQAPDQRQLSRAVHVVRNEVEVVQTREQDRRTSPKNTLTRKTRTLLVD
jgi:hypothetical protein